MRVPAFNQGLGRVVHDGSGHGGGIVVFQYSDHRLKSQGVDQPGLAFGPIPGPFYGRVIKYLPAGLGVLAVKSAYFPFGKIGQG
jgi:hypothetical protein